LRHQHQHADGFQCDCLASGIRSADQQRFAIAIERERDRDHAPFAPAQHVGEQRMPCFFQE